RRSDRARGALGRRRLRSRLRDRAPPADRAHARLRLRLRARGDARRRPGPRALGGPGLMRRRVLGGFTLLEVMVAVAILALSLVAIFSSEGGAIRAGARARQMSAATLLARCKMAEV